MDYEFNTLFWHKQQKPGDIISCRLIDADGEPHKRWKVLSCKKNLRCKTPGHEYELEILKSGEGR